ncbi:tetratricopeptide repeat protein, partial [Streptomyces sp. NPDC055287]
VRHNLAGLLKDSNRPAAAEAEFTAVHETCREVFGERHPRTRAAADALLLVARLRTESPADTDGSGA